MDEQIFRDILTRNALLQRGDTVIACVSAGPDSTALLCLLCRCHMQFRIIPVYVDHGLRPQESIGERQHVNQLANRFGLPFESAHIDATAHKRQHGTSLEESCRILRYRIFEEIQKKYQADAIVLGHTANDQTEEMLLRLFRGTGLQGLSGMSMKNGDLVRPLLHTPKQELINYLDRLGIGYCIDSSNTDRSFLRNRLRLDVLPSIEKHFNRAIQSTLLKTSAILQEENAFLDQTATRALQSCASLSKDTRPDGQTLKIDIQAFLAIHRAIGRRVVEKAVLTFDVHPDFHHIDRICHLAAHGRNGMEHHLPYGLRVYVSGAELIFDQPEGAKRLRQRSAERNFFPVAIDLSPEYIEVAVPEIGHRLVLQKGKSASSTGLQKGTLLLDMDTLPGSLILRSVRKGERFVPTGMKGRKKVNRFLADRKIAQQKRRNYPVLTDGENIVAVVGLRADERYAAKGSTSSSLSVSWLPMVGED